MNERGRNDVLYKHSCRLIEFGNKKEELHKITSFTNKYFFNPTLEHREYIATLRSAFNHLPSGKNYGSPITPVKKAELHWKIQNLI